VTTASPVAGVPAPANDVAASAPLAAGAAKLSPEAAAARDRYESLHRKYMEAAGGAGDGRPRTAPPQAARGLRHYVSKSASPRGAGPGDPHEPRSRPPPDTKR
jgi:hypothetical protein